MRINITANNFPLKTGEENSFDFEKNFKEGKWRKASRKEKRKDNLAAFQIQRIVVLSDVSRVLAYLHSEVRVIHRNVENANLLLDRGCPGRIGDFGIVESPRKKVNLYRHESLTK
jgi:serine/threonine protein kinase